MKTDNQKVDIQSGGLHRNARGTQTSKSASKLHKAGRNTDSLNRKGRERSLD